MGHRMSLVRLILVVVDGVDQHELCASWAASGECQANPGFMLKTCASSCVPGRKQISEADQAVRCQSWVKAGECKAHAEFMAKACPSSCGAPEAPRRNVTRNLREEQLQQQAEIQRRAEELRRQRRAKAKTPAPAPAETPVPAPVVEETPAPAPQPLAPQVAPEAPKPWQMPAPSDVDDATFHCMREKFEIARQLDDATSREQSVRERAEAAHSRTEAVEQRHRDCLKELAEANADRQRMRAQQSDAASEHMEQRLQEAKEQQKKELELQSAKMEKDCRRREFQLQELARVASKRADEAEAQLAGRATGLERLQAEERALEHAKDAQAAEQARLQAEEAYRVEGSRAAAREQELRERLSRAEAKALLLEKSLEAPREQLCEANAAEALSAALLEVFQQTSALLWTPKSFQWQIPSSWDAAAESFMEALAARRAGGVQKELCRGYQPGGALLALVWLASCICLLLYGAYCMANLAWSSVATKQLAQLLTPVSRFFDAFSVPEDVRLMAERRAELPVGSGSEPEPEQMQRPAALEALLAEEPRPSPRFGLDAAS